jgi:hypothetical protein
VELYLIENGDEIPNPFNSGFDSFSFISSIREYQRESQAVGKSPIPAAQQSAIEEIFL